MKDPSIEVSSIIIVDRKAATPLTANPITATLRHQGEVGEYQSGSIVPRFNTSTPIQDNGLQPLYSARHSIL